MKGPIIHFGFMMKTTGLMVGLHVFTLLNAGSSYAKEPNGDLMVCYYSRSRFLPVENIPANLCTHIIFSAASVTRDGIVPRFTADLQAYKILVSLKKQNPNLKVMLSLQTGFSSVVDNTAQIMDRFASSAVQFLQLYGFDGIDLDWEYPKGKDEQNNYRTFIKIFSAHLKNEGLLLSAALANNPYIFQCGYVNKTFSVFMDFNTVMTYDFHLFIAKGDNLTGYNSPLFTPKGEMSFLSTSAMLTYFLQCGIPASKLLMGLPLYGRSWTLAQADQHGLHAPAIGRGSPAPYSHLKSIYLYPDTCVALQQGSTLVMDKTNVGAYLYHNTTWVAFDNVNTIDAKMTYMKAHGLGGVDIWAMHLDDSFGVCKKGSLPLLNAIKSRL